MTIAQMREEIAAIRLKIAYAHGVELVDLTVALDQLQVTLILAQERLLVHSMNQQYRMSS